MHIHTTLRTFRAGFAAANETYLGCPVDVSRPTTYRKLLEKVDSKLHAWKTRLLSPAGKIVLLKSVIEAISLYHMSTALVHKSVLDKIQSRCTQFFWGKANKNSICFTKWGNITRTKLEGGLGLRDLQTLNNTMIIKNIWKIASGDKAIWIQIVKAKYHLSISFWHTQRHTNCTTFWRALLHNRAIMAANLKWVLGDGQNCAAYDQPWFQEWREISVPPQQHLFPKVASLFNNTTLTWNSEALIEFGGPQIANSIIRQHTHVVLQQGVKDKLMFTWATNGEFTIKKAYQMLQQLHPLIQHTTSKEEELIWKRIWKNKTTAPRVKTF